MTVRFSNQLVAELIQPFWARAAIERRDSLAAPAAKRTHLTNSRAQLAVSFGPDQGRAVASRGTPCEEGVAGPPCTLHCLVRRPQFSSRDRPGRRPAHCRGTAQRIVLPGQDSSRNISGGMVTWWVGKPYLASTLLGRSMRSHLECSSGRVEMTNPP
jgi:hypothetical protein